MRICISGSSNLTPFISVPYKIAKADWLLYVPPEKHCQEIFFVSLTYNSSGIDALMNQGHGKISVLFISPWPHKDSGRVSHLTRSSLLVLIVLGTFILKFS